MRKRRTKIKTEPYTLQELSEKLGIYNMDAREYIKQNKIESTVLNGKLFFDRKYIDTLLLKGEL